MQSEQPPLTWNHWTYKETTTYDNENPCPTLVKTHNVEELERLMGSNPFLLLIIGYPTSIQITKFQS
jgi:hypothetical protein